MANYSKLLSLISGRSQTIDFSLVSNILELGGGGLQMNGSTSGHIVISASAVTSTYSIVWPAAQAASAGYTLSNDGTGVLTWVPAASGSITAITINSANGFSGSSSGGSTPALTIATTITGILQGNGTAISAASTTGSGAVVLATSPTLVTPALGTPSALVGTNITGTASGFTAGNVNATSNSTLTTLSALSLPTSQLSGTMTGAQMLPLPTNQIYVGNGSNQPAAVAMSGDATIVASGALTLATVNSDVGSFGSSTSIPSFTVNAKGLITAASGNAVIAPAGTLSGTTLNPTVVTSSLTSLGTQSSALDMGNNQINNVANGTATNDAVNYGQLQAAITGLYWQGPAKAYSVSNVSLTGSTPLVIDGYTVLDTDLIILANQTTASENGEYSTAITGGSYTLTPNGLPTAAGDAWLILNGTVYGDSAFVADAAVPAATFTQFAGPTAYTFTAPIILTGRTISITQSSASTDGYLSSTDWNTFNNKQPAGSYITALTGDGTAAGPGSSAFTLSTVNSNVGTFASVTVNAKGLVTAASALTGDGTTSGSAFTLATVNGSPGTFAIASVTVNAKGLVTSATAASTTGTGNVVLSTSPTLTGTVNAANIALSGKLVTPTIGITAIYGDTPTLAADTTYALRWGMPANSETANKLYLADWDTTSFDLFWVIGMYNSGSTTATDDTITVVSKGSFTLGGSDTVFGSPDQGRPVWLGATGTFGPNSTFAPSSGDANMKLGIAQSASIIYVDFQMMGVS